MESSWLDKREQQILTMSIRKATSEPGRQGRLSGPNRRYRWPQTATTWGFDGCWNLWFAARRGWHHRASHVRKQVPTDQHPWPLMSQKTMVLTPYRSLWRCAFFPLTFSSKCEQGKLLWRAPLQALKFSECTVTVTDRYGRNLDRLLSQTTPGPNLLIYYLSLTFSPHLLLLASYITSKILKISNCLVEHVKFFERHPENNYPKGIKCHQKYYL